MKNLEIKFSIKIKYILFITILILLISSINAYLTIRNQSQALKEAIVERAKITVRKLADDSREAILTKDDLTLFAGVKNIMQEKDVLYAMILDENRKLICHNDPKFFDQHKAPLNDPITLRAFSSAGLLIQDIMFQGQAGFDVSSSIASEKKLHGTVRIGYSRRPIETAIQKTTFTILFITVIGLVIGTVFTILLTTYIIEPINVLMKGAERIAAGDLEKDIRIKQKDEFQVLAGTFNTMQRSIKRMMSEIAEKEAIKRELQIAARIQQMLIPKSAPEIPGMDITGYSIPATEIGGDYFDFFSIDKENLGTIIADVSGHGIAAALIMVMLRTIFRTTLKDVRLPSEILTLANKLLTGNIEERFITMLYYNFNHRTRQLTLSNAGHWPLIWYKGDEKKIEEVTSYGVPIGIYDDPKYEDVTITMKPGDMICGFTDGFIEIENPSKEQFGFVRLKNTVLENQDHASSWIIKKIIDEADRFSQEKPRDDKTIVIFKVKE